MAHDRYTKMELQIRLAFRDFMLNKLAKGKENALYFPQVEIPRGETVDVFVAPKQGTTICIASRSDFVMVYRHTVGQLVGTLTHFHRMNNRELRDLVRGARSHPDAAELGQGKLNVVNTARRIDADRAAGKISLALVTEVPEVPQQAKELAANFLPIADALKVWLCAPVKKKKLCCALEVHATLGGDQPKVLLLSKAIKPFLKES